MKIKITYMNWIEKIGGIIAIVLGINSALEKNWIIVIIIFFLLTIYFIIRWIYLWYKSQKEEKNKLERKIKMLQSNACLECKKIYIHKSYCIGCKKDGDFFSFDEDLKEKRFSEFKMTRCGQDSSIYFIDKRWIVINFLEEEREIYLFDIIGRKIYLPVSEWKKSKGSKKTSYKVFLP